MSLTDLSEDERRIIFECLTAAAHGPFFTDADHRILSGLSGSELAEIVARLPDIDDAKPVVRRAVGHALTDLMYYPHRKDGEWANWISASRDEVERVGDRWLSTLPPIVYESFEVFGPACFGGRYYRVVGYKTRAHGRGWSCEVWHPGGWVAPRDGPGGPAIIEAAPASALELASAGVDCSPIPSGYDPLAVELESPEPG